MARPRSGNRGATGPHHIHRGPADVRSAPQKPCRSLLPSATNPACRQQLCPSTVAILGRCVAPGQNRAPRVDAPALRPATNTATDTRKAAQPPEIVACQLSLFGKIAASGETECFTMSGTIMDTPPDPVSAPDLTTPGAAPLESIPSVSPAMTSAPRETALSPLVEIFVGSNGLYPGVRWLIYLSIAYGSF